MIQRIREELLGQYFSTRSELRHMAEKAGINFVPVEIVDEGEHEALATLHVAEAGEIRVRAVRPVASQPFLITAVEPV